MSECHCSWQAQHLVIVDCDFSWQAQYLVKFGYIARARNVVIFNTKLNALPRAKSKLHEQAGSVL